MSGTTGGDELALLVASFVEEVQPFFAGIRRGVAGIFAMPRDAHAITAARGSLGTIAASATMLDLPAARQLAELAQLLDEAFRAAERGGVPDESHAPLLLMVDDLEARLDGLPATDEPEHGRARLDNSYHLLEQVLHTVEEAETAPAPALEIDLDDLLLTLQPAAPVPPVVPAPELEPEPVAPAPEPEQADLVLLAEEEVAPIEWGEKEARLWEKGGWDESQAAYGNTGWIFLDEDETGPLPANVAAEDVVIEAAGAVSAPPVVPEPAPDEDRLVAVAPPADEAVPAASAPVVEPVEALADVGPLVAVEHEAAATPIQRLDYDYLEEATLLALDRAERDAYLALDRPTQAAYLGDRLREMHAFASEIGLTVTPRASVPVAEAAAQPPLDAALAADAPTDFVEVVDERPAPEPPVALPDAELAGAPQDVAAESAPPELPAQEDVLSPPAGLDERAPVLDANDDDLVGAEQVASPAAAPSTDETAHVTAGDLPVLELHAVASGADDADSAEKEEDRGFLDSLLDDEPPARDHDRDDAATPVRVAGETDEGEDAADFAVLPDVDSAIEAAFAQLNDADMATFLTLDGESALAFLQSRGASEEDAQTHALPLALAEDGPAAADAVSVESAQDANLDLDPEILEVFLQEAQELLAEWATTSARLRRAPADRSTLADLRRVAHTLKGAANMMGFVALADCGRMVEELLDLHDEQQIAPAPPVLDFVDHSYALVQALSADTSVNPAEFAEDREALTSVHAALTASVQSGALAAPAAPAKTAPPLPQATASVAPEDELEAADDELIEVFTQEAEDHLAGYNRALVALDRRPDDSAQLAEAKRVVHTLKGAAAALGYPVTAGLCHSLEDLFEALDERGSAPSRELLTLCFESGEVLEGLVAGIAAGRSEDAGPAEALRARYVAFLGGGQVAAPLGIAELAARVASAGQRAAQCARGYRPSRQPAQPRR